MRLLEFSSLSDFVYPEHQGDTFPRNVDSHNTNGTPHPRRRHFLTFIICYSSNFRFFPTSCSPPLLLVRLINSESSFFSFLASPLHPFRLLTCFILSLLLSSPLLSLISPSLHPPLSSSVLSRHANAEEHCTAGCKTGRGVKQRMDAPSMWARWVAVGRCGLDGPLWAAVGRTAGK